MKTRMEAIGLVTSDMAASLAFYRRLGFDIPDSADAEQHVSAHSPGGGPEVMWDTVEMIRSIAPEWTPPSGSHRVALCFAFDSPQEVDAAYAELTGAGHRSGNEPFDAFWGQRYATVLDPDGNAVDLYAWLPDTS